MYEEIIYEEIIIEAVSFTAEYSDCGSHRIKLTIKKDIEESDEN